MSTSSLETACLFLGTDLRFYHQKKLPVEKYYEVCKDQFFTPEQQADAECVIAKNIVGILHRSDKAKAPDDICTQQKQQKQKPVLIA